MSQTTNSKKLNTSDEPRDVSFKPLSLNTVKELSKLNPFISTTHIVAEWTFILLSIYLSAYYLSEWPWIVITYPLTVILIGSRQHALAVFMHDGAHHRLIPHKLWNDIFGELIVGWPILLSMRAYRKFHFAHHRKVNTNDDPDWVIKKTPDWDFPKTRRQLALIFLRDLLGLETIDLIKNISRYSGKQPKISSQNDHISVWFSRARLCYYLIIASLLTYFNLWLIFFCFWIVPLFTWLKFLLRPT